MVEVVELIRLQANRTAQNVSLEEETIQKIEVRESPVELDELGKTLLKARDYIREHGWYQNHYVDSSAKPDEFPRVCVMGACNWAAGFALDENNPGDGGSWRMHQSVARRMGFANSSDLADWNDTTDRTQQEVEERLERAAYNL